MKQSYKASILYVLFTNIPISAIPSIKATKEYIAAHIPSRQTVYKAIFSPETLIASSLAGTAYVQTPEAALAGLAGTALGSAYIATDREVERAHWQKALALVSTIGAITAFVGLGSLYAYIHKPETTSPYVARMIPYLRRPTTETLKHLLKNTEGESGQYRVWKNILKHLQDQF